MTPIYSCTKPLNTTQYTRNSPHGRDASVVLLNTSTPFPCQMDALAWRATLVERDPTENMMRWMRSYETPCRFACCYSSECAMIMCSHCHKSLTADGRMQTRWQCMECPVLPPDEPSRRPEFCEDCWHNPDVLHWHSNFCKVDAKGVHTGVHREIGVAASTTIQEADLTEYPGEVGPDTLCFICYCGFEADGEERPRGPPGCIKGHGEGIFHPEKGLENVGPAHAECWIQMYRAKDALQACKSPKGGFFPVYCSLCDFEAEMAGWRRDFDAGFALLREGFANHNGVGPDRAEATKILILAGSLPSCAVPDVSRLLDANPTLAECEAAFGDALDLLHPQPWIQAQARAAREGR